MLFVICHRVRCLAFPRRHESRVLSFAPASHKRRQCRVPSCLQQAVETRVFVWRLLEQGQREAQGRRQGRLGTGVEHSAKFVVHSLLLGCFKSVFAELRFCHLAHLSVFLLLPIHRQTNPTPKCGTTGKRLVGTTMTLICENSRKWKPIAIVTKRIASAAIAPMQVHSRACFMAG